MKKVEFGNFRHENLLLLGESETVCNVFFLIKRVSVYSIQLFYTVRKFESFFMTASCLQRCSGLEIDSKRHFLFRIGREIKIKSNPNA